MTDELVPKEPTLNKALSNEPEPFVITPELQAAIDTAVTAVQERTYAGRNPQLGKMINCQVCRARHRAMGNKCEQVFTHRVDHDNYELLRENEQGELVPDYRTCTKEGERPTMKQLMGAAAFNKKRFHPHLSKIKLLLVEYTREFFEEMDFSLDTGKDPQGKVIDKVKNDAFEKNLQRARVVAARRIRKERRLRTRATNRQADKAHRINRGLLCSTR